MNNVTRIKKVIQWSTSAMMNIVLTIFNIYSPSKPNTFS